MADFSTVVVTQSNQAVVLSTVQQVVQVNSAIPGNYLSTGRLGLHIYYVDDPIYDAQGDGVTNDTAALQAAIDDAGASGVQAMVAIPYSPNPYLHTGLTGRTGVTLIGIGGRPTLKTMDSTNATAITGTSLDDFHVVNIEIDGNKANQSSTGLADTPVTTTGPRGIFLDTCTHSSVERCYVHDCRFHGVLFSGGSDNWAEHLEASANGSLAHTCYGNGLYVGSSPRFSGRHIYAHDNDANSGVSTVGGSAGADMHLSDITATGNGASNITLNSLRAKLVNATASGSLTQHGLNLGHDTSSSLYCDDVVVVNVVTKDNAVAGIAIGGVVQARLTNVLAQNNTNYNLLVYGGRAGELRFVNCEFDTTTTTTATPEGVGVYLTASGAASTLGDILFEACDIHGSQRQGLKASGVSKVRFLGGSIYDNGNFATGPGIVTEDNGAVASDDVVAVGTNFYDTRSGASRTQTVPMATGGTGVRCRCLMFDSRNHLTNDNPQMTASSTDFFFGAVGGSSFLGWGSNASSGTLTRSGNLTAGIVDGNGFRIAQVTKFNGTYDVTTADHTLFGDATSGNVIFSLPTATSAADQIFVVVKIDNSVNTVRVVGNGSDTINGVSSQTLSSQYQKLTVQSDGTQWFIIA